MGSIIVVAAVSASAAIADAAAAAGGGAAIAAAAEGGADAAAAAGAEAGADAAAEAAGEQAAAAAARQAAAAAARQAAKQAAQAAAKKAAKEAAEAAAKKEAKEAAEKAAQRLAKQEAKKAAERAAKQKAKEAAEQKAKAEAKEEAEKAAEDARKAEQDVDRANEESAKTQPSDSDPTGDSSTAPRGAEDDDAPLNEGAKELKPDDVEPNEPPEDGEPTEGGPTEEDPEPVDNDPDPAEGKPENAEVPKDEPEEISDPAEQAGRTMGRIERTARQTSERLQRTADRVRAAEQRALRTAREVRDETRAIARAAGRRVERSAPGRAFKAVRRFQRWFGKRYPRISKGLKWLERAAGVQAAYSLATKLICQMEYGTGSNMWTGMCECNSIKVVNQMYNVCAGFDQYTWNFYATKPADMYGSTEGYFTAPSTGGSSTPSCQQFVVRTQGTCSQETLQAGTCKQATFQGVTYKWIYYTKKSATGTVSRGFGQEGWGGDTGYKKEDESVKGKKVTACIKTAGVPTSQPDGPPELPIPTKPKVQPPTQNGVHEPNDLSGYSLEYLINHPALLAEDTEQFAPTEGTAYRYPLFAPTVAIITAGLVEFA